VVNTSARANAQRPEDQAGQPVGQTEGTRQAEQGASDSRQPEGAAKAVLAVDAKKPPGHRALIGAIGLLLVAAGCLIWLIFKQSLPLWGIASLAVLAAVAAGAFAWFFVTPKINERLKQSLVVGVSIITLIVALLAIPPSDEKKTTQAGTTLPGAASISPSASATSSTSETESDPLAANLRPGRSYGCEGFIVKNSLLILAER
jgi:hypothetical protein